MSPEPAKTITCPSCSNINPTMVDECLKCGLDLRPIKDALAKAGIITLDSSSSPLVLDRPKPIIPTFPEKEKEDLGKLLEGELVLIRGAGDARDDMVGYFFQRLFDHEIPNLEMSEGTLLVDNQQRQYYFIQKYLQKSNRFLGGMQGRPLATIAVTIFKSGKDLMIEWRNYIRTSANIMGMVKVVGMAYVTAGVSLLFKEGRTVRDPSLRGFEDQDNSVMQLGVRAALEEAIDLCGINHNLVQNLSSKGTTNRLI